MPNRKDKGSLSGRERILTDQIAQNSPVTRFSSNLSETLTQTGWELLESLSAGAATSSVSMAIGASLASSTGRNAKPDLAAFGQSAKERLFDASVDLKVAVGLYAMHLSRDERARLFGELDYLLDAETWDESDSLPSVTSFQQFLKWVVFTQDRSWTSMGIDIDGNILVAWVRPSATMTANFSGRVRWAQKFSADDDVQTAAGDFSLAHFAKHAEAFLATEWP